MKLRAEGNKGANAATVPDGLDLATRVDLRSTVIGEIRGQMGLKARPFWS